MAERMRLQMMGWLLVAVVSMAFPSRWLALAAQAQAPEPLAEGWSQPVRLSTGPGSHPTIAIDPEGRLHVMWTANVTGQEIAGWGDTIFYVWFDGQSWSAPVDVLAVPAGDAADAPMLVSVMDERLHLFWLHNDHLMHSWAWVREAGQARAWQTGRPIAEVPRGQTPCHAVAGIDGVFHVVCARAVAGIWSVAYYRSTDSGETWLGPSTVADAAVSHSVSLPRLAVAEDGAIQVVWSENQLPDGWPPQGIYTSRSGDGGTTWSLATQLAGETQAFADILTVGADQVHIVWNGSAEVAGRYHRWSPDGGDTWSSPSMISLAGGMTQGAPVLAADSRGWLYAVFFGQGASDRRADDMRFSTWDGVRWSEPGLLSAGASGVYVGFPALQVSQGNQLHTVWANYDSLDHPTPNLEANLPGIWYTSRRVDAPSVLSVTRALPEPTPTGQALATAHASTSVASEQPGVNVPGAAALPTPALAEDAGAQVPPLVAGVVPVLVLAVAVAAARSFRRRMD